MSVSGAEHVYSTMVHKHWFGEGGVADGSDWIILSCMYYYYVLLVSGISGLITSGINQDNLFYIVVICQIYRAGQKGWGAIQRGGKVG